MHEKDLTRVNFLLRRTSVCQILHCNAEDWASCQGLAGIFGAFDMNKLLGLAAALVAIAASATPALAVTPALPTIVDGNFSQGSYSGGSYDTLADGSNAITGWTVEGSVDWIKSYWQPSNNSGTGAMSLDLAGDHSGGIYQQLTGLVAGTTYHIEFSLSGNPNGAPFPKVLEVGVAPTVDANGGTTRDYSFTSTTNTVSNMQWQTEHFTFTASQPTAYLYFQNQGSNPLSPYGAALSNVKFSAAVPETGTWAMMIIGFGLIGMAMRRRSSKVAGGSFAIA